MKESKFSNVVCGLIAKCGHVSKVEASTSAAGIPDLDYCVRNAHNREGHIELKVGNKKKPPHLRPSQVRWFLKRTSAGGRPFFLCLDTDTDTVYAVPGQSFHFLKGKVGIEKWISLSTQKWQLGSDLNDGLEVYLRYR